MLVITLFMELLLSLTVFIAIQCIYFYYLKKNNQLSYVIPSYFSFCSSKYAHFGG